MAGFRGFKVMEINSNGCFPGASFWMMINPYYQKNGVKPVNQPIKKIEASGLPRGFFVSR